MTHPLESLSSIASITSICEVSHITERADGAVCYRQRDGEVVHIAAEKCGFEILPEVFLSFDKLEKLFIGRNKFKVCPDSLAQLKSLKELYIYGNDLKTLPDSLGALSELRILDLSHQGLESLPVWSQFLVVHYFPWNGRMHYGANSTRQRQNDRGCSSSNTK